MERQYYPQRLRYHPDGRKVGTISVGEIFYIPDNLHATGTPVFARPKEPWRVEVWIPHETITWNGRHGGSEVHAAPAGILHLCVRSKIRARRERSQTGCC